MAAPIEALAIRPGCQLEQPGFAGPLVQPVQRHREIGPTVARPVKQRLPIDQRIKAAQEALHRRDDAWICAGFLILRKCFQHHEHGPRIIGFPPLVHGVAHRAKPAVGVLALQDRVDPASRSGDQAFVVEQKCQRYKSIQPVRTTLPTFRRAADPGTVGDVGPDLIEMPA